MLQTDVALVYGMPFRSSESVKVVFTDPLQEVCERSPRALSDKCADLKDMATMALIDESYKLNECDRL